MNHKPTLVLGVAAALAAGWVAIAKREPEAARPPAAALVSATAPDASRQPLAAPPAPASPPAAENFPDFSLRPFSVAKTAGNHEWTAEDGKQPEVIHRLAHNRLEERKMLEENPAVYRRELVYRKQVAADLVKEAERSGAPLKTLVLPGFDGEELGVEINKIDSIEGGAEGTIYGRLSGRPDSLVTLTFIGRSECFSLLSPDQNLFLQGDPREPGEIILKKINPALMGGEEGSHPDLYDVGASVAK